MILQRYLVSWEIGKSREYGERVPSLSRELREGWRAPLEIRPRRNATKEGLPRGTGFGSTTRLREERRALGHPRLRLRREALQIVDVGERGVEATGGRLQFHRTLREDRDRTQFCERSGECLHCFVAFTARCEVIGRLQQ